jgi:hypothetical protein
MATTTNWKGSTDPLKRHEGFGARAVCYSSGKGSAVAENFVIEKFLVKMLARAVAAVLLVALLAYPVDWAIWRIRVAQGGGMGNFQVNRVTVAELKGGKEDYYLDGTTIVSCSSSLYPQGGYTPCWWVKRHPEVIERY